MNERRLTEQLLLLDLLILVVDAGASNPGYGDTVTASKGLHAARVETYGLAPAGVHHKLVRRVEGTSRTHISPHIPFGINLAIVGLALYLILDHLHEEHYLQVGCGTPLATSLGLLWPSLQPNADNTQHMNRAALMADDIFRDLQGAGYFQGVVPLI